MIRSEARKAFAQLGVGVARLLRLAAAGTLPAVLVGCANLPDWHGASPASRAKLDALQTTDPTVQRARWGDYASLAGTHWLGESEGKTIGARIRWIVPGAVLEESTFFGPYRWDMQLQYNPQSQRLDVFNLSHSTMGTHIREVTVEPDGTAVWPPAMLGLVSGVRVSRSPQGELIMDKGPGERYVFRQVAEREHTAGYQAARDAHRQAEKRKDQESAEFWSNVAKGLQGTANSMTQAQQQKRQQELDQHYRTMNIVNQQRAASSASSSSSKSSTSRSQAASGSAKSSKQASSSAREREAAQEAAAQEQAAEKQAAQEQAAKEQATRKEAEAVQQKAAAAKAAEAARQKQLAEQKRKEQQARTAKAQGTTPGIVIAPVRPEDRPGLTPAQEREFQARQAAAEQRKAQLQAQYDAEQARRNAAWDKAAAESRARCEASKRQSSNPHAACASAQ